MPDARALSSPSGEAAEDNVEETENSEVKQFFGLDGIKDTLTDGQTDGWTDRRGICNRYLDMIFSLNP